MLHHSHQHVLICRDGLQPTRRVQACVNLYPAARGSQDVGFTKLMAHLRTHICRPMVLTSDSHAHASALTHSITIPSPAHYHLRLSSSFSDHLALLRHPFLLSSRSNSPLPHSDEHCTKIKEKRWREAGEGPLVASSDLGDEGIGHFRTSYVAGTPTTGILACNMECSGHQVTFQFQLGLVRDKGSGGVHLFHRATIHYQRRC